MYHRSRLESTYKELKHGNEAELIQHVSQFRVYL